MTQETEDSAPPQDVFFHMSGTGNSPWEIRRVQSAIVKLVEQDMFHGEILDIGCGIGDNAIYIATHASDVHVTAIDMVSNALETAREKARQSNLNIRFDCVNMLDDPPPRIFQEHSFDVILDSAVFHVFSNADRQRYVDYLRYVIKPGGLYVQLSSSEKEPPGPKPGARRIKKVDLFELFSSANGWTIESIEDSQIELQETNSSSSTLRAYLSLIRRNKNI